MRPIAFLPLLALFALFVACPGRSQEEPDEKVIEITDCETAVLDPVNWDQVFAGERYYDAVRPLLVRFPTLDDQAQAEAKKGYKIAKVELVLEWEKQEGARPQRGRSGWGSEKKYTDNPAEWQVQVRPLLRSWSLAAEDRRPTASKPRQGQEGYWQRSCARGEEDCRPPVATVPLHHGATKAVIDLTEISTGELRDRGLKLTRPELYYPDYAGQDGWWFDVYNWSTCVGYMRVWIKPPKLRVTLSQKRDRGTVAAPREPVPAQADPMALPADWAAKVTTYRGRPEGMPDWQWERVRELRQLGQGNLGRAPIAPLFSEDPDAWRAAMKKLLASPPGYWYGHLTTDLALLPHAFPDLLPPAVHDHLRLYWRAWLHPEIAHTENPKRRSYFRQYAWSLGTQNFNYNATAGTYLGGQYLGSEHVLRDARYGLENIMLRNYAFYGGANQEIGDTYYQALSNAAPQMIAKYADDPFDRLLARITSERLTEQLVSMYNPGIRRLTHPMGRGEMKYQCAYQDGPYFVVHSLSKQGALLDLDQDLRAKRYNVPLFGREGPPARMATLMPWAPLDWANMVDDKPLPWQARARYWAFDDDRGPAEWHTNYLTENYSLASRSDRGQPVSCVTAQWRRRPEVPTKMEHLSTLQLGFGVNGYVFQSMGSHALVQDEGRVLAYKALPRRQWLKSPPNPDYAGGWRAKENETRSQVYNAVHSSVAIIAFGDVSERRVWVGDKQVEQLSGEASPRPEDAEKYEWEKHLRTTGKNSVWARQGQPICIEDGVTYVGLIPLAASPLARDREVEIAYEWPVLYVHSFLYRGDEGLDVDAWYGAERKATAGFYIEMGSATEDGDFETFRKRIQAVTLTDTWDAPRRSHEPVVTSGEHSLGLAFRTWVQGEGSLADQRPIGRSIDGRWPPLPEGVDRRTPWSVQSRTGQTELRGWKVASEPGSRIWLTVDPHTDIATICNPVPDPVYLTVAGKTGSIGADARLGLCHLRILPRANEVHIQHQLRPDQVGRADLASGLIFTEFAEAPTVFLNGERQELRRLAGGGWAVPLSAAFEPAKFAERLTENQDRWPRAGTPDTFRDFWVAGPFPAGDYAQSNFLLKDFGPEKGYDPEATYEGLTLDEEDKPTAATVRWDRALKKEDDPRLGQAALNLRGRFAPDRSVIAYAAATIVSDEARTVQLLTGGDERLDVFVNGERVIHNYGWRIAYQDQDRAFVKLRKGENPVLLKLCHGYEEWRLFFRVADEYGRPIPGITYRGAWGDTPAVP